MPARSLRPCGHTGCRELVRPPGRRCAAHAGVAARVSGGWAKLDANRGSAQQRGYTKAWSRARLAFLAAHPLCSHCQAEGRLVPATVADHVKPHRGDLGAFWSGGLQPLCRTCHGRKSRRENGLVGCAHRLMAGEVCAHCGRVPAQGANP